MDRTFEDNIFEGLLFCAALTGRRRDHIPFGQAGAGKPDTSAEAVKPDPGSPWQGHSRRMGPVSGMKVRTLVVLSNHSAFPEQAVSVWPIRSEPFRPGRFGLAVLVWPFRSPDISVRL